MPETLFIDTKVDNNTASVQKHLLFRNFSDPDDIDIINPKSFQVKSLLTVSSQSNLFLQQVYSEQATEASKEEFLKDLFLFFKVNKQNAIS